LASGNWLENRFPELESGVRGLQMAPSTAFAVVSRVFLKETALKKTLTVIHRLRYFPADEKMRLQLLCIAGKACLQFKQSCYVK
jgi:hypothetical protein